MGTDRSGTYLRGILVPDPRITAGNVTPKDHATAPSAYTQARPFAGPATADQDTDLVLRTSGDQSADGHVEVLTRRSGGAVLEGAGFVWRDVAGGDTTAEYKGWDAFALVTGWDELYFTTVVGGVNIRPSIIRLLSGRLLCAYHVSSVGVVLVKRYDPDTSAWTSVNLTPTGAASAYVTAAAALTQLASGRVLAYVAAPDDQQIDAYYSDDDGDTWAVGGYRVLDVGVTESITGIRVAAHHETAEVLLFPLFTNSAAQPTTAQFASADLGAAFSEIGDDHEIAVSQGVVDLDLVPLTGGGWLVTYRDDQGAPNPDLLQRTLDSAFQVMENGTSINVYNTAAAVGPVAQWVDEDGVIYIAAEGFGVIFRSIDGGVSYLRVSPTDEMVDPSQAGSTTLWTAWGAASVGGRTALIGRWSVGGAAHDPQSVGVVWLGGHTSHSAPAGSTATEQDYRDTDYIAWDGYSLITREGGLYLPLSVPGSLAWTAAGAGSEVLVSSGELEVTSAANTRDFAKTINNTAVTAGFFEFAVEIDAADGSTAAEQITMTLRLANQTYDYEIQIRLADTGYRLYDVNAAANVAAAVSVDLTARKHVRVALDDDGNVRTWHCSDAHARVWTAGTTATGLTDGGAGSDHLIKWGHTGSGTDVSRWAMVGYCLWPGKWQGTQIGKLASSWTNPTDLHPRSFPARPALLTDGIKVEAISGPTWAGETWQISTAYEHPVEACLPSTAPSPRTGWRNLAEGVSADLAFDLESEAGFSDSFWESSSLGVFLVESNLQSCKLQGWNGAAWVDILALDSSSGFDSWAYTRKGRIVYADTGTPPTGERWSPHQMHAGDQMALEDGEATVYRRIAANSEGGRRSGTKLARFRLHADDIDGGEDASGTGDIYRRNFGGVVHNVSAAYRYIRLHIPAQKTWSADYRIGSLLIGPVFVFGRQYGDGWAWEQASNTDLMTRDSGGRSSRVLGPRRRAVELSWADQPQDTTRMWDSEPAPDYVTGVTAGDPVASIADTAYQVLGLTERTDGAHSPVVYLGRIARGAGAHLYTMDPEWLYGRLTTATTSMDHVVGDEGVSVVGRLNRIRIEEEV